MTLKRIGLLSLLTVAIGCSSPGETKDKTTETKAVAKKDSVSKEEMMQNINALRAELKASKGRDKDQEAKVMVDMSYAYAQKYKGDSLAPEYLFVAGGVAQSIGEYDLALKCFDKVISEYPTYLKRPESIFYTALIYDQNLSKMALAKERYEMVIKEYPMHTFARDAEQSIKYLGKSNEEIIQSFEEKQ